MKFFVTFLLFVLMISPLYSVTQTDNLGLYLVEDGYDGSSPTWPQMLRSNFSILDQAVHEAGSRNVITPAGEVFLGQDYCDLVIALCEVTNDNPNLYSYSTGFLKLHRMNGINGGAKIDVNLQKYYNSEHAVGNIYSSLPNSGGIMVTRVTFTYGGKKYAGVKVHQASSCLNYVTFVGDTNLEIFGVAYYNHNSGTILNSEVYNSIQEDTWYSVNSRLSIDPGIFEIKAYTPKMILKDIDSSNGADGMGLVESYDNNGNRIWSMGDSSYDGGSSGIDGLGLVAYQGPVRLHSVTDIIRFYTNNICAGNINKNQNWTMGSIADLAGTDYRMYVDGETLYNGSVNYKNLSKLRFLNDSGLRGYFGYWGDADTDNLYIGTVTATDFHLITNNSTRLTIDSDGTSTFISHDLEIKSPTGLNPTDSFCYLIARDSNNNASWLIGSTGTNDGDLDIRNYCLDQKITFYTSKSNTLDTANMVLSPNGGVTIGSVSDLANVDYKLYVNGLSRLNEGFSVGGYVSSYNDFKAQINYGAGLFVADYNGNYDPQIQLFPKDSTKWSIMAARNTDAYLPNCFSIYKPGYGHPLIVNDNQNVTIGGVWYDKAGTDYKLYVDGDAYFSKEIKQKSNWGIESYLSQYQITTPLRDYSYWVVGLVDLTNDSITAERFAFGDLYITRYNGANYQIHVNFAMSKPYNDDKLVVAFQNLSDYGMSLNLTPCTFTYNGRKYGGFSFASTNSPNRFRFIGESNNKMFAVAYKDTQDNSVINQEINDSIVLNDNYRCTQYYKRNIYGNITLGGGVNEDLAGTDYKLYVNGYQYVNGQLTTSGIIKDYASELQIYNASTNYSSSPVSKLTSYVKYNAAGDYAEVYSISSGKENTTDGDNGMWTALSSTPNGGSSTKHLLLNSSGNVTIGGYTSDVIDRAQGDYKLYVYGRGIFADDYVCLTLQDTAHDLTGGTDDKYFMNCIRGIGSNDTVGWEIGDIYFSYGHLAVKNHQRGFSTQIIALNISGVEQKLDINPNGTLYWNSSKVWTQGNDGSGSGLDADLLDGHDSNYFWNVDNDGSGSGLDADLLDGFQSQYFLWSRNYGASNGVLIKTDIPDSSSRMFFANIYFNHYTTTSPEHLLIQGYIYGGDGQWYGLRALGLTRSESYVRIFIKDGYVHFWIPGITTSETIYCKVFTQYDTLDHTVAVTNEAYPTLSVSKSVQINIEGVNADVLDGYNSSKNPDPNTVVVRDSLGAINVTKLLVNGEEFSGGLNVDLISSDVMERTQNLKGLWLMQSANTTLADSCYAFHDGTSYGGVETSNTKKAGGFYYYFDGINDYIDFGDNDDFSFTDGTNDMPFSVTFVFNPDSTGNYPLLTKRNYSDTSAGYEFVCYSNYITLFDGSNANYIQASLPSVPSAGVWHVLTYVYNGNKSTSGFKVYLDGLEQSINVASNGTYNGLINTASKLYIGACQDGTGASSFFDGKLAFVSLEQREMNEIEVYKLYKYLKGAYDL